MHSFILCFKNFFKFLFMIQIPSGLILVRNINIFHRKLFEGLHLILKASKTREMTAVTLFKIEKFSK